MTKHSHLNLDPLGEGYVADTIYDHAPLGASVAVEDPPSAPLEVERDAAEPMDVKHCRGCTDDLYNARVGGGCWHRRDAAVVTRYRIGTWTNPTQPCAFTEVEVPTCYRRQGEHFYERLPDFVRVEDVRRG